MKEGRYFLRPPGGLVEWGGGSESFALQRCSLNGGALRSQEVHFGGSELRFLGDATRVDLRNLYAEVVNEHVILETDGLRLELTFPSRAVTREFVSSVERWVIRGEFESEFSEEAEEGRGTFARVFRARRGASVFAVKEVVKGDERSRRYVEAEIDALRRVRHAGVVQLIAVFEAADRVRLVTELLPGGSLATKIREGPLSEKRTLAILVSLLPALAELRRLGLLHRDLKPQNVLFDQKDRATLIDFGFAARIDDCGPNSLLKDRSGTPGYLAPELLDPFISLQWDFPSDLFSLGVLIVEALTTRNPFVSSTLDDTLRKNQRAEIDYSRLPCSVATRGLIAAMTTKDPRARLSLQQAISQVNRILSELGSNPPSLRHSLLSAFTPRVLQEKVSFQPQVPLQRLARFSNVEKPISQNEAKYVLPIRFKADESLKENSPFFKIR